ncbi:MAG TPA: hypothetical protein VFJ68_13585 [Casimicrobiaceae bacterium]|nr:hypothetical protein [Casimicrobiaceae bacterium]
MRAFSLAIAAIFVAGCATAPVGEKVAVYDHKNNTTRYAYRSADSDFVGTSTTTNAPKTQARQPSWYIGGGHP